MKRNKKMKRGFTIAEVVVAMVIITAVSISTIKVVQNSRIQAANSSKYALARLEANNALEAFKYASDEDEFYSALLLFSDSISKDESIYTKEDNFYTLTVTVNFDIDSDGDGEDIDERDFIYIRCVDSELNKLFDITYYKGN